MCRPRTASLPPRHGSTMTAGLVLASAVLLAGPLPARAADPSASPPSAHAPAPTVTPPAAILAPAPLSLAETLERIASSSQASVDRELDIASSRRKTREARARLFPSVDFSGAFTANDHAQVAVFDGLTAALTDQSYLQGRLAARYVLWNGGLRSTSIAVAQAYEEVAGTTGDAHVVASQLRGMGAYLQAMAARAEQKEVAKRITAVKAHLAVARDMYDQGMVARNDVLETEVRLRTVQDQASALADQEVAATRELNRIMGEEPSRETALPGSLPKPPTLGEAREALVRTAVEHSPAVRAARATVAAAAKQEELQHLTGWPDVFAQADHTYAENSHMLYQDTNSILVGLSWNLYDGGARAARREQASLAAAKAERALEEAQRTAASDIDRAYRDYRQALREARTARANITAAAENLRIEEDQYRAGLVDTTDVLDAEALLAQSRFSLIAQHYSAYLKQARVLALAGRDLAAFYRTVRGAAAQGERS